MPTVDPPAEERCRSYILHPSPSVANPVVVRAKGNYMFLDSGERIFDATGGPAVACIGHGDWRVQSAVVKQMEQLSFCHSLYWSNGAAEGLAGTLVSATGRKLARAVIYNSGSEAVEAAMKLARQHFVNLGEPARRYFIARRGSFHGTTLGALALTDQTNKRHEFEALLASNVAFVSTCHPYRDQWEGETLGEYATRLATELDDEFLRLGEGQVCAFVAETVVGSSLGCVPPVPGYFQKIHAVCEKHGALMILDEVMCGMGRTGTMYAWEQEAIVPDIVVVAKGLGGGYAPVSALLMHERIVLALQSTRGFFNHGHTHQAHSVGCAAASEVQRIIQSEGLIRNVREMGLLLGVGLKAKLGGHPHVGDIRGRGLMWAIELVRDKVTKAPFPARQGVAMAIRLLGLQRKHGISLQPGRGSLDGINGDHIILAPAYNVTVDDIEFVISKTAEVVTEFFLSLEQSHSTTW